MHGRCNKCFYCILLFVITLLSFQPEFLCNLFRHVSSLSTRVINAGKSALNEDQARCEVLVIKRKPGGNPTSSQISMTRRRSSLPNGEGFDLPGSSVSQTTFIYLIWQHLFWMIFEYFSSIFLRSPVSLGMVLHQIFILDTGSFKCRSGLSVLLTATDTA